MLDLKRVLILILLVFPSFAWADKPAPDEPFKVYSSDGKYFVQMVPRSEGYGSNAGSGKAFEVGSKQMLWEVAWYERDLILANDGLHLIRLGSWGSDDRNFSDFAIGFYEKGRELKTYQVKDLLKNPAAIVRTVSHYFWQGSFHPNVTSYSVRSSGKRGKIKQPGLGEAGLSADGSRYTLYLVDGSGYSFDVKTGEILERQGP